MSPRARKLLVRFAWVVPWVAVLAVIAFIWVRGTLVGKVASGLNSTSRLCWAMETRWRDTVELPPGEEGDSYVVETNAAFARWLNTPKEYFRGSHDSSGCPLYLNGAIVDPWSTPFRVSIKRSGFRKDQGKPDIAPGSITVESAGPDRDFATKRDNLRSW